LITANFGLDNSSYLAQPHSIIVKYKFGKFQEIPGGKQANFLPLEIPGGKQANFHSIISIYNTLQQDPLTIIQTSEMPTKSCQLIFRCETIHSDSVNPKCNIMFLKNGQFA
jgi:hypothetical protein